MHYLKGLFEADNSNNQEATFFLKKSLTYFVDENDLLFEAKIRLALSRIYADEELFVESSAELFKARNNAIEIDDKILTAKILESLAHLFYKRGDIGQSLIELEKVIPYYLEFNDSVKLSRICNNLAVLHKNNGDYEKAIAYNVQSLDYGISYNNKWEVSQSYNNIGTNYLNMYLETDSLHFADMAIWYYNKAAKLKKLYPHKWNNALTNLEEVYNALGEGDLAAQYEKELIKHTYNDPKYMQIIYQKSLKFAILNKETDKALMYYSKLDSVEQILKEKISYDFEQMLNTQNQLFETEREKAKIKKEEEEKRLEAERAFEKVLLTLIAVVVGGVILFLISMLYYKNVKHRNEKERNKLKNTILRNQMNPHFIFNVLTAIQNTLFDNDPLITSSYISRFAKLIRQNFDLTHKEKITLSEDLSALNNYIETQRIRFGNKFNYRLSVAEEIDIDTCQIPPMMLQPLCENAIEHGLRKIQADGFLEVKISKKQNKLLFEVIDNGVGYQKTITDGKEHSFSVLKSRLSLADKGDELSLKIENRKDTKGTIVRFSYTLN
ncbi:histidine kinase [Flammeovirga yaeyamensis]|uniref:Histidine kinase n=1 Tax=Flammeovirga yaeyamensis TaxID=367791 RepID=A0AAX1NCI0_9BACT|nr:histidine kinase [Flammeovirga yaeyamensis]MBB3699962.1 two-component sensor histidine kinase [Flammeovirga yaeyamensis]NMF37599.1 histidine kinase [Flammeovirga yaeyamensis]QWG04656.1 histidine kinase [Flammeovirga yaeyamensis]